ncbi:MULTISPECIES: hypothetical protein [unclassified Mycobacterium]|uniref:hypothetical protein n=1 Tax=unclassified Mycobacterium TaxID=2642494 RepID=UPI00096C6EB7|nr:MULTISPECIES: hypothetical protein [unclassified Mycobacterium]OMC15434.1 hypothetical protein A5736_18930 [Mycobacterium sp. SP-6446]OMC54679.1 hypothetical protein A5747_00765 [Mycobacterium sp. IS-836]
MTSRVIAVASVAGATVLAGMVVAACSGTSTMASTPSTSTSAVSMSMPAAGTDYTALLIQGSDVSTTPPNVFTPAEPPVQNPNAMPGAAVVFKNQDDSTRIGDTVLILTDAGAAANAMSGSVASLGNTVTGGNPQPISVGDGGTIVAGTSPDRSKEVTVLLFTEGKAFVTLEFDGAPGDDVPTDYALTVAQQQDGAVKNKLSG